MSLNKQKEKTRHHQYYLDHKEKMNKQSIQWDKTIKQKAIENLGGKCKRCGIKENLQLHHKYYAKDSIRPTQHESGRATVNRAKESLEHPERFNLLCLSCHNSVEPKRKKFVSLAGFEEIRSEVKEMVQAQFSETFLKGEDINELGITKLKILDEGSYVKGNYGDQLQVRVLANDKEKKKFKWSLASKPNDMLIKMFGKDTAEWVGKEVEVTTEPNKKGNPSVVVKPQGIQGKVG